MPLTQVEVDRMLHKTDVATAPRTRAQFTIGESVKVISGPLSDFSGEISEINEDAAKLKVLVSIFGDPGGGPVRSSEKALDHGQEGTHDNQAAGECRAGEPRPPVGPALGQHGINIMEFCKAFNAQTQGETGTVIPVVITVYEDRSFTFVTKTPPAAVLIKQALRDRQGLGSAQPYKGRHDHPSPAARDCRA